MNETACPCGSGRSYAECCEKIIKGTPAETPEALMRARYRAYAKGEIDFIMESIHSSQRDGNDREDIRRWSQNSEWNGLEIIRTEKGGPDDEEGVVEFRALYTANGEFCNHHERSTVVRENGEWRFSDGDFVREPLP